MFTKVALISHRLPCEAASLLSLFLSCCPLFSLFYIQLVIALILLPVISLSYTFIYLLYEPTTLSHPIATSFCIPICLRLHMPKPKFLFTLFQSVFMISCDSAHSLNFTTLRLSLLYPYVYIYSLCFSPSLPLFESCWLRTRTLAEVKRFHLLVCLHWLCLHIVGCNM